MTFTLIVLFNKIIIKFILFISNKDDYCAVQPPSTNMLDPVIKDDASDARNTKGPIRSLISPSLLSGILEITSFSKFLFLKKPLS